MNSCKEGLYKSWEKRVKKEYWLPVQARSQPQVTPPDTKGQSAEKNVLHPICYPCVSWFHISVQQFIMLEHRIENQSILWKYMGLHPSLVLILGPPKGSAQLLGEYQNRSDLHRHQKRALTAQQFVFIEWYSRTYITKYYLFLQL